MISFYIDSIILNTKNSFQKKTKSHNKQIFLFVSFLTIKSFVCSHDNFPGRARVLIEEKCLVHTLYVR